MDLTIRDAHESDAEACAAIYAPYVRDTAISFESEPPDARRMAERIAAAQRKHAWLVGEDADSVVGYAYAHTLAERAAYSWACELSVYIDRDRRRAGAGRALYAALLERMTARGFRRAVGLVALPNDASVRLHEAFGFHHVGRWERIGWKHGAWHDVALLERDLGDPTAPPEPID